MANFIIKRQQHLINPVHSKSVQANTLLVTGIPAKYLTKEALTTLFGELPGGVKRVFINRDLKELPDIYERRLAACNKLEGAETKLLSIASKLDKDNSSEEAAGAIPRDKRPTHKLGFLGLFGEKVDTIDWARTEIRETTRLLDEGRAKIEDLSDPTYPPLNSAFIMFHNQLAAHLGKQVLLHHEPYRMTGRHIEISPEDVIWSNLGMNPYEKKVSFGCLPCICLTLFGRFALLSHTQPRPPLSSSGPYPCHLSVSSLMCTHYVQPQVGWPGSAHYRRSFSVSSR